jgi:hypothetical protein
MLPFTREQFFEVFAAYNQAIWPAQVVAYLLAGACLLAVLVNRRYAHRFSLAALAVLWAWTAIAYHWLQFATVNPAAVAFAIMFLVQAIVLASFAARPPDVEVDTGAGRRWLGWALVAYATVIYPLLGYASGHVYPAAPTFGVTPCPLVIFTFGLLLIMRSRLRWALLAIPVAWAVIGGSAAFLLGVPQDWALPLAAGITVWMAFQGSPSPAR